VIGTWDGQISSYPNEKEIFHKRYTPSKDETPEPIRGLSVVNTGHIVYCNDFHLSVLDTSFHRILPKLEATDLDTCIRLNSYRLSMEQSKSAQT
jgi:hypothetical protein